MKTNLQEKMARTLGYFDDSGIDRKLYRLLLAAYNDETDKGLAVIEEDPDQINRQDPHSGLTALHIAIYRQNVELVTALAQHPKSDVQLKDTFGRRPVDILDYTQNQKIFESIMDATYPDSMQELEAIRREDEGNSKPSVVPFKPKPR